MTILTVSLHGTPNIHRSGKLNHVIARQPKFFVFSFKLGGIGNDSLDFDG